MVDSTLHHVSSSCSERECAYEERNRQQHEVLRPDAKHKRKVVEHGREYHDRDGEPDAARAEPIARFMLDCRRSAWAALVAAHDSGSRTSIAMSNADDRARRASRFDCTLDNRRQDLRQPNDCNKRQGSTRRN